MSSLPRNETFMFSFAVCTLNNDLNIRSIPIKGSHVLIMILNFTYQWCTDYYSMSGGTMIIDRYPHVSLIWCRKFLLLWQIFLPCRRGCRLPLNINRQLNLRLLLKLFQPGMEFTGNIDLMVLFLFSFHSLLNPIWD